MYLKKKEKEDVKVPEGANVKVSLFQMMGPSNKQVLFTLVGCFFVLFCFILLKPLMLRFFLFLFLLLIHMLSLPYAKVFLESFNFKLQGTLEFTLANRSMFIPFR